MLSQSVLLVVAFGLGLICCCVGQTDSTNESKPMSETASTPTHASTTAITATSNQSTPTTTTAAKSNQSTPTTTTAAKSNQSTPTTTTAAKSNQSTPTTTTAAKSNQSTPTTTTAATSKLSTSNGKDVKTTTSSHRPSTVTNLINNTSSGKPINSTVSQETEQIDATTPCNKMLSLVSESERRVLELFFLGLPIGLVFILMCTLTAILLFVTNKHLKKSKDEETGGDFEDKADEEINQQHQKETKSEESEKESNDQKTQGTTEQDSDQKTEGTTEQNSDQKTEGTTEQNSDQKTEGTTQQDSDQKTEGTTQQDSDQKIEGTTQQDSDQKTEGTTQQDSDQKTEGTTQQDSDQKTEETGQISDSTTGVDKKKMKNMEQISDQTTSNIVRHNIEETVQEDTERDQKRKTHEDNDLTGTVEKLDTKELEQDSSTPRTTKLVQKEEIATHAYCTDKPEKTEISAEKPQKESDPGGMIKTENEFQTSIDILTSFIKESEGILEKNKCEQEMKQDEIEKEEKILSSVTSVNFAGNRNQGSKEGLISVKQPDEKLITNSDKTETILDEGILVESERDIKSEINCHSKSQNEDHDPNNITKETNQVDPTDCDIKYEPHDFETHMPDHETDPPLPPPPEQNIDEKVAFAMSVESVEPGPPPPPSESSDSSCATDESEKEDSE